MAKIYLSSTYSDLSNYRSAVYAILRSLEHNVIAMEDYAATDKRPAAKCLADVASCDLYIGLIAWRIGYVPAEKNPKNRSITEMEYRHAGDSKVPRLMFLAHEDADLPPGARDSVTGDDNNDNARRPNQGVSHRDRGKPRC